jgi:hypothetical protein
MTSAVTRNVRFNAVRGEVTWVLPEGSFTGLAIADRQALSAWLDDASDIYTVTDLTDRPWNVAGARTVFGVFEIGKDKASWLVVRHRFGWTVACCADGFISDVSASLQGVLKLIDEQRRT